MQSSWIDCVDDAHISVIDLFFAHSLDIKGMSSKLGLLMTNKYGERAAQPLAKRAVPNIAQQFATGAGVNLDEMLRPGTRYDLRCPSSEGAHASLGSQRAPPRGHFPAERPAFPGVVLDGTSRRLLARAIIATIYRGILVISAKHNLDVTV